MNAFLRKLAWLMNRRSKEDQLSKELQFHLEEEAEELQKKIQETTPTGGVMTVAGETD